MGILDITSASHSNNGGMNELIINGVLAVSSNLAVFVSSAYFAVRCSLMHTFVPRSCFPIFSRYSLAFLLVNRVMMSGGVWVVAVGVFQLLTSVWQAKI